MEQEENSYISKSKILVVSHDISLSLNWCLFLWWWSWPSSSLNSLQGKLMEYIFGCLLWQLEEKAHVNSTTNRIQKVQIHRRPDNLYSWRHIGCLPRDYDYDQELTYLCSEKKPISAQPSPTIAEGCRCWLFILHIVGLHVRSVLVWGPWYWFQFSMLIKSCNLRVAAFPNSVVLLIKFLLIAYNTVCPQSLGT